MLNINTALGCTDRPLEVGDWIELVDDRDCQMQCDTKRLLAMTWPQQIAYANKDYVGFAKNDDRPYWSADRFRRVPPPASETSEVEQLREQVLDLTHERDRYKQAFVKALACVDQAFQPDGKPEAILPDFCRLGDDKFEAVPRLAREHKQLSSKLSTVTAERDSLAAKLAEVEKERDELRVLQSKPIEDGEVPEYGTRDYDQFESGITWTMQQLAELVGVKEFDYADGSETLEGDVAGTIRNILDAAKLYSKEAGKFVTEQLAQASESAQRAEAERDELELGLATMSEAYADLSRDRDSHKQRVDTAEADAAAMREALFSQPNGTQFTSIYTFITNNTESEFLNERIRSWCKAHANVLLNLDQSNLGRDLLDRHAAEIKAKDAEIRKLKAGLKEKSDGWERACDDIKDLENELDRIRSDYVSFKEIHDWASQKPVKRVCDVFELNSPISIIAATIENLRDSRKRYLRKARKAKAALVATYRGQIDPAWFGEVKSVEWQYRRWNTETPGFGVAIWRTIDGNSIESSFDGRCWSVSAGFSSWRECCDDARTYPCDEHGKPLSEQTRDFARVIEHKLDNNPELKATVDEERRIIELDQKAAMLDELQACLQQGGWVVYRPLEAGQPADLNYLLVTIRDRKDGES